MLSFTKDGSFRNTGPKWACRSDSPWVAIVLGLDVHHEFVYRFNNYPLLETPAFLRLWGKVDECDGSLDTSEVTFALPLLLLEIEAMALISIMYPRHVKSRCAGTRRICICM